ncbi:mucin-15 isoform X1 [Etheostoma spectabile]|nr:mucin-15 isoform X1 [Etheostoma spectabile]
MRFRACCYCWQVEKQVGQVGSLNATLLSPPPSFLARLSGPTADSLSHVGRSVKSICCLCTCSHLIYPLRIRVYPPKKEMGLHLKLTAGLLLLVQAFHLASLQDSTDSPGRTIDKSWLRAGILKHLASLQNSTDSPGWTIDHSWLRADSLKDLSENQNAAVNEEETEFDQTPDANARGSSNELSSGIASGFMTHEEEENVAGQDTGANETSNNLTADNPTNGLTFPTNFTTDQPNWRDTTISPSNTTSVITNSSQVNITESEEKSSTMSPQNSTTHLSAPNSTSFSDNSNRTDLPTTTLSPESNATQESTKPNTDTGLTNATESTNTTTVITTMKPEIKETSTTFTTTSSSTTVFPSETTETSPETTTPAAPITYEKVNNTDRDAASGGSEERGLAKESNTSKRNQAWGAVLGTAVAVAIVGLVAYVILKKKHQKGFSHSKLVEEYPSDPVIRLDNSEPLDLNFGGLAYYNPGLQGDNIQMTNFPGRR